MKPRLIITVTWLACLLVSGAVWAQGDSPVCPCWTAEVLEEAFSDFCLEGVVIECGEDKRSPGRVFAVRCLLLPQRFRFVASTVTPAEPSDAPSSCLFDTSDSSGNPPISLSDLTPNEAASCRQDILRVCPKLHP
jgi:hypothetical protein